MDPMSFSKAFLDIETLPYTYKKQPKQLKIKLYFDFHKNTCSLEGKN